MTLAAQERIPSLTRSGPARGESGTTRAGSDHSPLAREA